MNNTVIAVDQNPDQSIHGHGLVAGLFMALFVMGGLYLVARALRLVCCGHKPHAAPYSHRTH